MPARILFFTLPLAVDRDFHSIVEKTVWLGIVKDVESDFLFCSCISDLEEEPLCMALCIDIIRHK